MLISLWIYMYRTMFDVRKLLFNAVMNCLCNLVGLPQKQLSIGADFNIYIYFCTKHPCFNQLQSLYAIGSGGLLGLGLGKSRQKFLYLPEPENDFIFAIVCEELGLIGAGIVLILFALLVMRGYWIAIHARDRFGALLVVGITTLTAVQVFLNISVVTNLIPTTGISLPFFSYGGTALMIQLAEMGIILSVSRQIPAPRQE